jgi:hypothetical protein
VLAHSLRCSRDRDVTDDGARRRTVKIPLDAR